MVISEKNIRKLIKMVEDSDIESIEVSSWGRKVKITQKANFPSNGHSQAPAVFHQQVPAASPATSVVNTAGAPAPVQVPEPAIEETGKYVEIKSPMVGTLYAAPAPDAQPYVSLNEKITTGQVICIVEAMKLMNEIEADISGRIVKICVENAQPVEFDQTLFLIDPEG